MPGRAPVAATTTWAPCLSSRGRYRARARGRRSTWRDRHPRADVLWRELRDAAYPRSHRIHTRLTLGRRGVGGRFTGGAQVCCMQRSLLAFTLAAAAACSSSGRSVESQPVGAEAGPPDRPAAAPPVPRLPDEPRPRNIDCNSTPGSCIDRTVAPEAVQEARDAIVRYRGLVERCASAPDLGCALVADQPDPCGAPRPHSLPPSLRHLNTTAFYFDGERCYQPTHEQPGRCWMEQCAEWTSLAACETARQICKEEP